MNVVIEYLNEKPFPVLIAMVHVHRGDFRVLRIRNEERVSMQR